MGKRAKSMSEQLFEYGIHTEHSDVRAHVSVVNRTVYVFQTFRGVEAVERYNPEPLPARQPGVAGITATGWPIHVSQIEDLRRLRFDSWNGWEGFKEELSTSDKGRRAVSCVIECMRLGRFPLWLHAEEDDAQSIQIKGTDIVVWCKKRVQVKCDYRSGDKPLGTGNLYLQKAERNPLRAR